MANGVGFSDPKIEEIIGYLDQGGLSGMQSIYDQYVSENVSPTLGESAMPFGAFMLYGPGAEGGWSDIVGDSDWESEIGRAYRTKEKEYDVDRQRALLSRGGSPYQKSGFESSRSRSGERSQDMYSKLQDLKTASLGESYRLGKGIKEDVVTGIYGNLDAYNPMGKGASFLTSATPAYDDYGWSQLGMQDIGSLYSDPNFSAEDSYWDPLPWDESYYGKLMGDLTDEQIGLQTDVLNYLQGEVVNLAVNDPSLLNLNEEQLDWFNSQMARVEGGEGNILGLLGQAWGRTGEQYNDLNLSDYYGDDPEILEDIYTTEQGGSAMAYEPWLDMLGLDESFLWGPNQLEESSYNPEYPGPEGEIIYDSIVYD